MNIETGDIVTIIKPNWAGEGEIGIIETIESNTTTDIKESYGDTIYYIRLESGELVWSTAKELMKLT